MSETPVLEILTVADRGVALARHEGKPVFIEFAAPGDVARVALTSRKKSFFTGRVEEIITPSPHRVEPPCPYFAQCGGCAWQHLEYGAQLRGKAKSLEGFFTTRLREETGFLPPLPSPLPYGYRNRVTVTLDLKGQILTASMLARRSHRGVEIKACLLADAALNGVIAALPALKGAEGLRRARLLLQLDDEGALWAALQTALPLGKPLKEKLSAWGREAGLTGIHLLQENRAPEPLYSASGPDMTFKVETVGGPKAFSVPVGGFVQANSGVNRAMRALVEELSPLYSGKKAMDLYCGSGNFTLLLAGRSSSVTGIEGYGPSAKRAAENLSKNGFDNSSVLTGPVGSLIPEAAGGSGFWLLDPPRAGAAEIIPAASKFRPENILYISCAPETLLRDLASLKESGYRVEWIRAFDMFPQTAHLEAAALLTL